MPGWVCCVRYCVVDAKRQCVIVSLFVFVVSTLEKECVCLFWSISTSSLHTLRCVQVWPINPIVFGGPQIRNLILKQASRLDAFSGYPFRT